MKKVGNKVKVAGKEGKEGKEEFYKRELASIGGALLGLYPDIETQDGVQVQSLVPDKHTQLTRSASRAAAVVGASRDDKVKVAVHNLGKLFPSLNFRRRTIYAALVKIARSGNIAAHGRASWARRETEKLLPLIKYARPFVGDSLSFAAFRV